MARIPDNAGPITESQQSPLSSATADGGRRDNAWSRWWSKKISKPLFLAAISAGFLLGALMLYSSPGELSTPPFATIQLRSAFPIGSILYDVSQASPSVAEVTIFVDLPGNVPRVPVRAPAAELWLEIPYGIGFETCPPQACRRDPNEQEYTWSQTLDFNGLDPDANSGEALVRFSIEAHNFGYVFNNINASAAIPRVVLSGPGTATPTLYTQYNVASAKNYDWSALQPQVTNASEIRWDEQVTSSAAPGIVAVGFNQANEEKDNTKTFIAGALIGLAGGALLAAVQEWLHRNDDSEMAKAMIDALRSGSATDRNGP